MPTSRPAQFRDDGTVVTVDVHGCSVQDALYIIQRTLQEAFWRGRNQVVVIHGTSSSGRRAGGRTIKSEFERRLDEGVYAQWVAGVIRNASGGSCTLWINIGSSPTSTPIRVTDVVRRHR